MIRIITMVLIVVVNYVLQTTLLPHVAILGVTPDTALVLIVSYAILRGDIEGAMFGLFAGLVQDVSGGTVVGVFALLGFLTGYVCGKPFRDFFKENYFLPFFVVVGASLLHQFAFYVTTIMFTGQLDFFHYVRTIILPGTIYTASLSIPIYIVLHFANTLVERHENNMRNWFDRNSGEAK